MTGPVQIFDAILGRDSWGSRPAILGKEACDYGALLAMSESLADEIVRQGGGRGTRVCLDIPVSRDYIVAMIAAYRAGAVMVPVNPRATADEKNYVIGDSGARLMVTNRNADHTEGLEHQAGESVWQDLRLLSLAPRTGGGEAEDDDWAIYYTSGSTSGPKGVTCTGRALTSNIELVAYDLSLSPADRTIVHTPPAHSHALYQILTYLWAGASFVPWPYELLYPMQLLKAVEELRLTGFATNPTVVSILSMAAEGARIDCGSVRYVLSTGQPLYSATARAMASLFPQARIVSVYGSTEAARVATYWLPVDVPEVDGPYSVGWPLPGFEVRIVDDSGAPLDAGETGKVLVAGRGLMRGYWNRPNLTEQILQHGWYRTGDAGYFDADGRLNITGRVDNVIRVVGTSVSPEEIEAVITGIDGVADVAVTRMEDALLGYVPVALIVCAGDAAATQDAVIAGCRDKLSSYKVPRKVVVVEAIPKNLHGKTDRRSIEQLVSGELETL